MLRLSISCKKVSTIYLRVSSLGRSLSDCNKAAFLSANVFSNVLILDRRSICQLFEFFFTPSDLGSEEADPPELVVWCPESFIVTDCKSNLKLRLSLTFWLLKRRSSSICIFPGDFMHFFAGGLRPRWDLSSELFVSCGLKASMRIWFYLGKKFLQNLTGEK